MANTVQTDEMRAANIPPLETEALRRAAEGCASGDADECEACPFRQTADCGGELIRCLLLVIEQAALVIEQAAVERKALIHAAATGRELCDICEHNSKLDLRACDEDGRLSCGEDYPACESCPCHDCTEFEHFSADMSEGSADE